MAWIFIIGVLVLMVYSRGFRKFIIGIAVIGVIGLSGIYVNSERQDAARKGRIGASELAFEDLRLTGVVRQQLPTERPNPQQLEPRTQQRSTPSKSFSVSPGTANLRSSATCSA